MTAVPRATNSRIAIGSRVRATIRGSKPAARHARAISPSVEAADHGSPASCAELDRLLAGQAVLRREPDQERLAQQVVALEAVVLAARQRRVLERDAQVQLAARTRSASAWLSPSCTWTSTSGTSRRRRRTASGTSAASALGNAPIRRRCVAR